MQHNNLNNQRIHSGASGKAIATGSGTAARGVKTTCFPGLAYHWGISNQAAGLSNTEGLESFGHQSEISSPSIATRLATSLTPSAPTTEKLVLNHKNIQGSLGEMDLHTPDKYSQMSQDNDFNPLFSQYTQSSYSPPLVHGSFPVSPFGGSPFGFRPVQPLKPKSHHVARRSALPSQPQVEVTATPTMMADKVANMDMDLPQQRAVTKLPAKRKIQEVDTDLGEKGVKGRKKTQPHKAGTDENNKEKKGRENWKDTWVVQLIHVRGAMHNEFGKTPKQGVDLWSKVATQLASLFPDCDKNGVMDDEVVIVVCVIAILMSAIIALELVDFDGQDVQKYTHQVLFLMRCMDQVIWQEQLVLVGEDMKIELVGPI
ncbi:hypothetical protein L7F22_059418 [Adiantum nelumboides]|nr:hypothetical protein [Adiantum nelumboides]